MATGPTYTSSGNGKKLYSQKLPNNSRNSNPVPQPHPPLPPPVALASDDSSSSQGCNNSIPGYVKFDENKVRISLNNESKSAIRVLKRKLVSELDQIRSLRKRLEAKETNFSNGHNGPVTLARVNSEVSYVGPTNSGGLLTDKKNNNNSRVGNKKDKILSSESGLKPSNGSKKGGVMARRNVEGLRKCGDLLEKLMKHQYGWVFNKPVDVKKLKLHDYFTIIKHPMDLGTVKSRLKKNWYKSPKEFAEDVRLTFNNAMKYNEKGQDVHIMADVLLKLFEEKWAGFEAEFNNNNKIRKFDMGHDANSRALASKRASAPPPTSALNSTPLRKTPSESRILARSESILNPMDSRLNAANAEMREPASKNPKEMEPQKREMTFEEKQRLSTDLLNLPSDKLDSVVQIMRKRNPGLSQQGDEIEVDIDSFDSETLWELSALVTNYKKNKGSDEAEFQARGESGSNIPETNVTSPAADAPESEAGEKFVVASPGQRERQGDNVSRSSDSGSSSNDSGSSLSDSDSGSSSSDGGQ